MGLFNRKSDRPGTELVVTPVWGATWQNAEVAGESNYATEIKGLLPSALDEDGQDLIVDVLLVREPTNKFDRNAVSVRATTGTVGYLPRQEAARYAPVLDALAENGRVAQTTARVWGCMRQDWDSNRMSFMGSVRIALPEPHMLFPVNLPPQAPYVLLPAGSAIQVSGEENYRANLAPWLNAHGEAWVHATLSPVVETTARTSKTVAEVSIDGRPVGRLTPKMSQDMLPVVEYLGERGLLTCVPAIVKGNPLKSDVVLYTARAGELGVEWFAQFEGSTGGLISSTPAVDSGSQTQPGSPPDRAGETAPPPPPPPTELPPANWYPDPQGVKRLRYWDGVVWTDHTAD